MKSKSFIALVFFTALIFAATLTSPVLAAPVSFAGNWETTLGDLQVKITGNQFSGLFPAANRKLEGTISADGLVFTGWWSDLPTFTAPKDAGRIVATQSADGSSFNGTWWHGQDGAGGTIQGKRPAGTEVTISPLYDNPPIIVNGVQISFKKYDMQRYLEGSGWKWTINFCEVYGDGDLLVKLNSEQIKEGDVFTAVVGSRSNPRTVRVLVKELPKVTARMECRGPVQPCWTQTNPVTRATQMVLSISVN